MRARRRHGLSSLPPATNFAFGSSNGGGQQPPIPGTTHAGTTGAAGTAPTTAATAAGNNADRPRVLNFPGSMLGLLSSSLDAHAIRLQIPSPAQLDELRGVHGGLASLFQRGGIAASPRAMSPGAGGEPYARQPHQRFTWGNMNRRQGGGTSSSGRINGNLDVANLQMLSRLARTSSELRQALEDAGIFDGSTADAIFEIAGGGRGRRHQGPRDGSSISVVAIASVGGSRQAQQGLAVASGSADGDGAPQTVAPSQPPPVVNPMNYLGESGLLALLRMLSMRGMYSQTSRIFLSIAAEDSARDTLLQALMSLLRVPLTLEEGLMALQRQKQGSAPGNDGPSRMIDMQDAGGLLESLGLTQHAKQDSMAESATDEKKDAVKMVLPDHVARRLLNVLSYMFRLYVLYTYVQIA